MRNRLIALSLLTLILSASFTLAEDKPYRYARWTPGAIYPDGKTKTSLEVWTSGNIKSILLSGKYALNDNGVNGDKKAGDGIWTYQGYTRSFMGTELIPGASVTGTEIEITPTGGSVKKYSMPSLGIAKKAKNRVKKAGPDAYYNKWAAFIIDKDGKLLDGKLPLCDVKCGKGNQEVFKRFYKYFPDIFDFLIVMPSVPIYRPNDLAENVPYFVQVRNNIKGIGIDTIDRGAEFGSAKKLKGIIYHSFGYGAILDHEIGHNWSAWIGDSLGFTGYDSNYHETYGRHYTQYSNLVGQMAAYPQLKLENNGDGTYKATEMWDQKTDNKYSPLTLYCMGLIPASQVPPVMILRNKNYPNFNRIPKSEFDIITINDIIAANGPRVPAWPNTQKTFRVGLVVVLDYKPTKAESDFFAAIPQYFKSKDKGDYYLTPFRQATGGRGKLNTRMAKPK